MIRCEADPDVTKWGLHTLLDVCSEVPEDSSCNARLERDGRERRLVPRSVENDAVIARALQEELSRIDAAEASGIHDPGQELIVAQDWLRLPGGTSERGDDWKYEDHKCEDSTDRHQCDVDEKDGCEKQNCEASFSSSSYGGACEFPDMEKLSLSLDIADELALDGEVGKRLNQMVPVPHIPKTNGEIPSEDEEISDHQRLLDRLNVYDLIENKVQGDGNCQFRALSDQLYRSPEHHKFVRGRVVNQLKSCSQMYNSYVPMRYNDYLKKMNKTGEWGDHVTLQAAADVYGVKVFVITSFRDTCYIEILPRVQKSERVIFLSFWAEVHYNSIYPEGELPCPGAKRKKKWWLFGN